MYAGVPPRLIVITSGKGGLGKTTTTANVGMCLARLHFKVGMVSKYKENLYRAASRYDVRDSKIGVDMDLPLSKCMCIPWPKSCNRFVNLRC